MWLTPQPARPHYHGLINVSYLFNFFTLTSYCLDFEANEFDIYYGIKGIFADHYTRIEDARNLLDPHADYQNILGRSKYEH